VPGAQDGVGEGVGANVGTGVGARVGATVGAVVGVVVGAAVGRGVGLAVSGVGGMVGAAVGAGVGGTGTGVGACVTTEQDMAPTALTEPLGHAMQAVTIRQPSGWYWPTGQRAHMPSLKAVAPVLNRPLQHMLCEWQYLAPDVIA
jgi:hypothetical protein